MLKALILSKENELIKNIGNAFREKVTIIKNLNKSYNSCNIFVFDDIRENETADIVKNLNANDVCIININSNYTIKNHNNFKKPFKIVEIFRKIENFISFYEKNIILINNSVKFNYKNRTITIDNNNISLTEKESDLIYFLHKNKQSTEDEILRGVWSRENNTDNRVLETIIYNLKQKLKNKQLIINNDNHYKLGK
ncbi:MAG: winged helix-turn-helix domain-containing protein [Rickettsiales bacterium]|jgi:hypothetical protein|nr:winged helix-turn-helix domain-containing protein [Rickettsiales bacterium]